MNALHAKGAVERETLAVVVGRVRQRPSANLRGANLRGAGLGCGEANALGRHEERSREPTHDRRAHFHLDFHLFWAKVKPKRPLMHKWPLVTE